MQTRFIGLQLDEKSALQVLRALSRSQIMEAEMMMEKGLSPAWESVVATQVSTMLGLSPAELAKINEEEREKLWEFSWYAFTNEWAWHRAEQEAQKIVTRRDGQGLVGDLKRLTEKLYRERYDEFVAELEMGGDKFKSE